MKLEYSMLCLKQTVAEPVESVPDIHSFIQYSVWRQVQSLLQNDASI